MVFQKKINKTYYLRLLLITLYFSPQQIERPNSKRERRGLSSHNPHVDHLLVLPRLFPPPHDHECGRRWHHLPLAAHHSLYSRLGFERHQPTYLRSHEPTIPRSLRQLTKTMQKQSRS